MVSAILDTRAGPNYIREAVLPMLLLVEVQPIYVSVNAIDNTVFRVKKC